MNDGAPTEVVASVAALREGIPGVLIDEGGREEAVVVP